MEGGAACRDGAMLGGLGIGDGDDLDTMILLRPAECNSMLGGNAITDPQPEPELTVPHYDLPLVPRHDTSAPPSSFRAPRRPYANANAHHHHRDIIDRHHHHDSTTYNTHFSGFEDWDIVASNISTCNDHDDDHDDVPPPNQEFMIQRMTTTNPARNLHHHDDDDDDDVHLPHHHNLYNTTARQISSGPTMVIGSIHHDLLAISSCDITDHLSVGIHTQNSLPLDSNYDQEPDEHDGEHDDNDDDDDDDDDDDKAVNRYTRFESSAACLFDNCLEDYMVDDIITMGGLEDVNSMVSSAPYVGRSTRDLDFSNPNSCSDGVVPMLRVDQDKKRKKKKEKKEEEAKTAITVKRIAVMKKTKSGDNGVKKKPIEEKKKKPKKKKKKKKKRHAWTFCGHDLGRGQGRFQFRFRFRFQGRFQFQFRFWFRFRFRFRNRFLHREGLKPGGACETGTVYRRSGSRCSLRSAGPPSSP